MKEYLVLAQHKFQCEKHLWTNVRWSMETKWTYDNIEEARKGLTEYLKAWKGEHSYNKDGTRTEVDNFNGFGIATKITKSEDDNWRVVAWKIKVREVTPWEELECDWYVK